MAQYPNFYETIHETHMRLRGTFVLYDGAPYNVMAVTNHKEDGIFRVYLDPIGFGEDGLAVNMINPPPIHNFGSDDPGLGMALDKWMEKYPDTRVIRKMMNSPMFNKFRPFPLGMCNFNGSVYYLERQPNRKTEQGLIFGMIASHMVNLSSENNSGKRGLSRSGMVDLYSAAFRDCIIGVHPSAQDCLDALQDPDVINEAAAFHRQFALVRGPLGMIFLAYKSDIVGVLPNKDLTVLRLGRDFRHTREVIEILNAFGRVVQD